MGRFSSTYSLASPLVALALLCSVALPHTAAGQRASSAPHGPDLLGIYIGMPADEAKVELQKHSADVYVQYAANAAEGFGLSLASQGDLISVSTTQPPSAPVVWRIDRTQQYSNQKLLPLNTLLDALHQKYGKETLSRTRDAGHTELYWIFDASGHLRSQADPGLMECSHPRPGAEGGGMYPQCIKEFFGLYVITNGTAQGVQSYTMVLVSDPLEVQSTQATEVKKADEARRAPRPQTADAPKF